MSNSLVLRWAEPGKAGPLPFSPGALLYGVVPLALLALPLALLRITVGAEASFVVALYLWSATVMIGWLAGALGSAIVFRLGARFRPPLWVITLLGPLLTGLVLREPIVEILALISSLHSGGPIGGTPEPMRLSWGFFGQFLLKLSPGTIAWIGTNYVFDRLLGVPRYRYPAKEPTQSAPAAKAASRPALPRLIERIPPAQRAAIIALRAEDHYVRIYTDAGEALTLLRLGDAIRMAAPTAGIRVHRSNWIADRAVSGFRRTGHTGIVTLSNGLEVPVSRSYRAEVEARFRHLDPAHR